MVLETLFLFDHTYNMERKLSTQRSAFFLRLLANYPGRMSGPDASDQQNFLSPTYSKFAVECD